MFRNLVLLLAALVAFVAAKIDVDEGVLVLDDTNFDEATSKHDLLLVEFMAPWCGHCKSLAPEWAKAAKTLENSPVKLAKVDATVAKGLADANGIRGFPTIKFFRNGKASDYNGGRVESEIVSWVNKRSGPAYVTVEDVDGFTNLQEANDVFVIGAFSDLSSVAANKFLDLAGEAEDLIYAVTSADSVKEKLGVSKDTVVVVKSFEDQRGLLAVDDSSESEDVKLFIASHSVPLIQEFTPESSKKIFKSPITKHVLVFTNKEADHHNSILSISSAVAANFRGKALFVNVPASEKRVLEYFGLKEESLPALVLAEMAAESGMKKFLYDGEITNAGLEGFLASYFAGGLKPTLKSESPAPEDTQGAVTVIKGASFDDLVINNTNDVLLEFYAPWCGHCKSLAPTYGKLGDKFKDNEKIVIAKIDGTANEIDYPGLAVKGFPSLYFFKGDDKANPVKYEQGRDLDDFVKYLQENAANKF